MQVTDPLFEFARADDNKVYSFEYILYDCIFVVTWQHET